MLANKPEFSQDDGYKQFPQKGGKVIHQLRFSTNYIAGFYTMPQVSFFHLKDQFKLSLGETDFEKIVQNKEGIKNLLHPQYLDNQTYTNNSVCARFVDPLFRVPFCNYVSLLPMNKIQKQLDDEEWENQDERRKRDDEDAWKNLKASQQSARGGLTYTSGQRFVPTPYSQGRFSSVGQFTNKQ